MNAQIQGLVPAGSTHEYIVHDTLASIRLDRFLVSYFPLYSRSFFKRLIDEGSVIVNGKQTNKQGLSLKPGDAVTIVFPQEITIESEVVKEQTSGITVVHTDEHFLIINKPAGITTHKPNSRYTETTVVDWLLLHHQEIAQIGYVDRPGIVHRLDKDTSGLMIIARTHYAHAQLSHMFKHRMIQKTYLALVEGHPPTMGSIDFQIGRHPIARNKMAVFNCAVPQSCVQKNAVVRDALTEYKVVSHYVACSLVHFTPKTGRTHQIRVHSAALGHPLLGDVVYGKKSPLIQRHALHAYALAFSLQGKAYEFRQDAPSDFERALQDIKS